MSFRIAPGETVGIVGRSGSGKSTLLRVLLALEAPTSGTVALGDRAVTPGRTSALRWYRRRVQAVPQDPGASLEPRMTVRQLIREPLRRLDVPGDHAAIVARALDDVGLAASLADRRPRELSGGQAQRVALARAIATSPGILLADEPVSGVDLPLRDRIIELLGDLVRERGLGLVLVSHDLDAVARLCGRSVVLAGGRIVEEGPTGRLLADPAHPARASSPTPCRGCGSAHRMTASHPSGPAGPGTTAPPAAVLLSSQLVFNLGFYAVVPFLAVVMRDDLGLGALAIGLVLGARTFSQQGLFLLGGMLADRFGPRTLIAAGCVVRVSGYLGLALAAGLPGFLVGAILTGSAARCSARRCRASWRPPTRGPVPPGGPGARRCSRRSCWWARSARPWVRSRAPPCSGWDSRRPCSWARRCSRPSGRRCGA
ncbi:Oligopeptide transport ATP-binding protein OppF [Clavibacter michiganensis subsp. michiganensis]|uniref:Oligopeptide transport ATP-binding protein OppF n=1 Tax=Clavibacter michiganensis subsp. michiganensis TaxID=33013 RepID=A0A251XD11_CLAMM|nr:Oligopeptide transport ATP-binding protein OppF [Clavibacter michiganensis subsp. michiganensis]OUE00069.1 Oligopeptide transport ATP-binding protein OppF [Clavibacter michiganensis subsp. michiganensis]